MRPLLRGSFPPEGDEGAGAPGALVRGDLEAASTSARRQEDWPPVASVACVPRTHYQTPRRHVVTKFKTCGVFQLIRC